MAKKAAVESSEAMVSKKELDEANAKYDALYDRFLKYKSDVEVPALDADFIRNQLHWMANYSMKITIAGVPKGTPFRSLSEKQLDAVYEELCKSIFRDKAKGENARKNQNGKFFWEFNVLAAGLARYLADNGTEILDEEPAKRRDSDVFGSSDETPF